MSDKKFYLTTPIYYVNARPHIGHAYTTIVADVLARRHRLLGDETFFLTGTDEHGQKIERSAAAAGIPPQQFADGVSKLFEDLWKRMGITKDAYIRTTDERHKRGVQRLFAQLYERGFIYLASYTGQYCVSDEAFADVPPGGACPDCGRITETLTEENFFFRLSEFGGRIAELIEGNGLTITPASRRNEVLSFVRGGLKDLSISRSSFTWGIPVPEPAASAAAQRHVIYVWLDALANYMTALGYGSEDESLFQRFWPADLHLVGKEIIRFHCVYWPAFLLAAGLPLPKAIAAHGWLLFDNSKMSKSKGNIVRTETVLDGFGGEVYGGQFPESRKAERDLFASDVLRYFLLRQIPFGQDGSFSFDALITRYNADLANGYGNLVSRTLKMVSDSFGGVICGRADEPSAAGLSAAGPSLEAEAAGSFREMLAALDGTEEQDFTGRLTMIFTMIAQTDVRITQTRPWVLAKSDSAEDRSRLEDVLYTAAESIRIVTALLYPVLPFATAKVWAQLGLGEIEVAASDGALRHLAWGGLRPGTVLGPLGPIFPRADKGLAQRMTDMENPGTHITENERRMAEIEEQTMQSADLGAQPRAASTAGMDGRLHIGGSAAFSTAVSRDTAALRDAAASDGAAALDGRVASQAPSTAAHAEGRAGAPAQIGIEDFAKVEMRVAQILQAERIPKADKLLRLEVDLGDERRQILSGIAEWYAPEDLVGRRIVVVTNLAPRRMRGLESHGMLLAASNGEGGRPVLATFGEEIALGSRLR